MAWHAKPSGSYSLSSDEGKDNCNAFYEQILLLQIGANRNAIIGALCNVFGESGLNPWRWQGDHIASDYSNGYGLFQYTPASSYINLQNKLGHSPNMSTTQVSGGTTWDAMCQINVFYNNDLGKWHNSLSDWPSYWSLSDYQYEYDHMGEIIATYGTNGTLSIEQFFNISNTDDSTLAWFVCFERASDLSGWRNRAAYASAIDDILIGGGVVNPLDVLIALLGKGGRNWRNKL